MTGRKKVLSKSETKRPYGRDEVRDALLRAANELFGLKGPDAVSVRDVAAKASVNHALLHRHFGSKEQLLRDVMAEHAASFLATSANADTAVDSYNKMFELMTEYPSFIRIVAYLLLSGHEVGEFVPPSGGVAKLAKLVAKEQNCSVEDAQISAAIASAFSMGWLLFESFVLHGAGYDGPVETARERALSTIENIIS